MNFNKAIIYLILVSFFQIISAQAQTLSHTIDSQTQYKTTILPAEDFTDHNFHPGIIRHIMLFHYRPEVSDAQRTAMLQRLMSTKDTALRNGIPYIVEIIAGEQNSHEGLGQSFDQVFIIKFSSEGDRNYYVGSAFSSDPKFHDPVYQEFKKMIKPLLVEKGILVFDFTADQK